MPVSQSSAALAAGMLIGTLRGSDQRAKRSWTSGTLLGMTAFIAVAASGIVIAFAVSTLPDQSRLAASFQRLNPGAWLVPRFWEQGSLVSR